MWHHPIGPCGRSVIKSSFGLPQFAKCHGLIGCDKKACLPTPTRADRTADCISFVGACKPCARHCLLVHHSHATMWQDDIILHYLQKANYRPTITFPSNSLCVPTDMDRGSNDPMVQICSYFLITHFFPGSKFLTPNPKSSDC